MDTPTSIQDPAKHHTRLFIVLALVILLALLFFLFLPRDTVAPPPDTNSVPESAFQETTLTPEQLRHEAEVQNDPNIWSSVKLTPAQQAAEKKAIEDLHKQNN